MESSDAGLPVRVEGPSKLVLELLNQPCFEITPGTAAQLSKTRWAVFGYARESAITTMQAAGLKVHRIQPQEEQPWERAEAMRHPPESVVRVRATIDTLRSISPMAGFQALDHGAHKLPDGRWEVMGEATDEAIERMRRGGCEVVVVRTAAEQDEQRKAIYQALQQRKDRR